MNGLPSRYLAFLASILVFALAVLGWHHGLGVRLLAILAGLLVAVGIADLAQTRSTLRRLWPFRALASATRLKNLSQAHWQRWQSWARMRSVARCTVS